LRPGLDRPTGAGDQQPRRGLRVPAVELRSELESLNPALPASLGRNSDVMGTDTDAAQRWRDYRAAMNSRS